MQKQREVVGRLWSEGGQLSPRVAMLAAGLAHMVRRAGRDEGGFTVAESLAMAAVGVVVVVALWAAMQVVGIDVIGGIKDNILGGGGSTTPSTVP